MRSSSSVANELWLAAKFAAVCMVGFVADALALRLGLGLGLSPAMSRLASLILALHITFGLSRWLVFHRSVAASLGGDWWRYMLANGFGSLCNYWIFVSLMGRRWAGGPRLWVALVIAAVAAYVVNYAGTRLIVFGRDLTFPSSPPRHGADPAPPTPAEP